MTEVDSAPPVFRRAAWLIGLGAVSGLGYAVLLSLSWRFAGDVPSIERPTMWMLWLFGSQFACYWFALRLAVRLPPTGWLTSGIFAGACLFRSVLLPSIPMHEIDIYRYIWDGAVLADCVSPYRYSPQQVVEAVDNPLIINDSTLQQLVELQASSKSLADSLREIHYGRYPSPYPLVSQAVFALSAKLTPDTASRHTRLVVMKSLLVLMDLATLVVVMLLLREVGLHPGWSLAYGWCPLLLKEVANGGHLDSIAIFLSTLAVWLLVRTWQAASPNKSIGVVLTSATLALAIGAKLYPVVLLPLFAAVWLRRHGWATMVIGLVATTLIFAMILYPLIGSAAPHVASPGPAQQANPAANADGQLNTPVAVPQQTSVDPAGGVQVFLKHWEMNDLIFMVVLENLRQQADIQPQKNPWFVITSDDWSRSVVTRWAALLQPLSGAEIATAIPAAPLTPQQLKVSSFMLTRVSTLR